MMCVRNSHMISVFFFALLCFATGVLAQTSVNCVPYVEGETDPACKYYRVSNADASKPSSALPKLCSTDDESIRGCPAEHRVPNADFNVYIPQAGAKGLHIQLKDDAKELSNGETVTSGSDGYLTLRTYSFYPIDNVHLGVKAADMTVPNLIFVLNFYAPEVRYFVDGELVSSASEFTPNVGDTIKVTAKLFIPDGYGPDAGSIDEMDAPFYFETPDESENLRFLDSDGTPLLEDKGRVRVDFKSGVAVFLVTAVKAVTDGSHFGLVGFPNKVDPSDETYGEYFVNDPFPGELQFTDRDLPSIKVAAIYDKNGDGIGDSIRVWVSGITSSAELDSFKVSWPTSEKLISYNGDKTINSKKDLYVLPDVKTALQDPEHAEGIVTASACTSLGGKRCVSVKADLKDSIGAVIQSVTIFPGNPEAEKDTLIIRFNKMVDTTWTQGQGLLLKNADDDADAIDVKVIDVKKNVWTFVVAAGKVSVGDSIKINPTNKSKDGVITAADGVPTAKNNQYVAVDNSGRIYASEKNGVYDRNGDGRMDSLSLGFDSPITAENLKNMKITFYWLDNDGKLLAITPDTDDLDLSSDGSVLGYALTPKMQDKLDVMEMLTEVNPQYMKSEKYGYAKIENKVTVDGKDKIETTNLELYDYMPPVIFKNFLKPESFQYMEADKFTISFTEPMGVDQVKLDETSLAFYVDGEWVNYRLEHPEWSDGNRTLTVRLETGVHLTERMNPADSVRFDNFDSGLCDKQGNNVSEKSPAVMVQGDPRVVTETASFADLTLAEELSTRVKPFTSDVIEGKFDPKAMSSLGVLLDVSFSTIMKKNSDGESEPDLKKIGLVYELDVYTNLGGYVGGAKETILCDDEYFFDGNCLENPEKIYVRWNMRAENGRKVGVGVYLAKFKVKVFGAQSDFKIERIYRWGITASRH